MEQCQCFGNAKYVKAEESAAAFSLYDPAPMFRKEFSVKSPKKARIFVQSPGFARYYINGKDITEDLFISAISDYNKILWYNTYEVTDLLCEGKNVISVVAGNGFLNESFVSAWHYERAEWKDAPGFCLRLEIDGETALVSDGSWKCDREGSHIIFNHIRSGEYHDMRKKSDAWMYAGFDDGEWQYAIEKAEPFAGKFRPVECQPVREMEFIEPQSITETESGYLVDFGVNMSGYIETRICEEEGKEIIFRYAEEVDEKGFPKHNGMDGKHFFPESPFHINKMIASGSEDVFKPLFSYHGFRYVTVEGLSKMPDKSCFTAIFTHQDVARKSEFESGNEIINFIFNAGMRSTYSNMFWCLTDCPTREKLGWMNDAQASVEQTLINFDILPLLEKWFEDMRVSAFPDGSLHGTIPSTDWKWGHACGPVCDCMFYELPYKVYLYTGKTDMLTSAIDVMESYALFLEGKCLENHSFILGDWLGYISSELTPKEFVRDFYLIKALSVTVFAQNLVGKENAAWKEKLEKYKQEFKDRYLDSEGRCTVASQCAISMMIMAGLYEDKQTLCKQLVKVVKADEYKLTCGMVGIQYIYDALSESGRGDIAYKLITETTPGYKSWFEEGATTLWEKWDGKDSGSHNHHMFSGVIAWFYKSLLGISPDVEHPGFERIELKPSFVEGVGFVKGSFQTVRGKISAEWRYERGKFFYTVDLPEGISARFGDEELQAGTNTFTIRRKTTMNTTYREDIKDTEQNKEAYRDGIFEIIKKRQDDVKAVRTEYFKNVFADQEKYRRDLRNMLGWPLVGYNDEREITVSFKGLSDEEDFTLYRAEFEILEGVKLSGLFFKMKGEGKKPLVIVQHGKSGSPEIISGVLGSTWNYNDMLMRVAQHDVHVFAPQLLLWDVAQYGAPYERRTTDAGLKRVGGSLAALELYEIMKVLDYFEKEDYVSCFGMVGLSYGGFYTLHTAALDERIKSALSCSFFASRDGCTWSDWVWKNSASMFDDAEVACLVYPRKICLQMGTKDEIFDSKYSEESFERIKEYCKDVGTDWCELILYDGKHEFCRDDAPIERLIKDLKTIEKEMSNG